MLRTLPSNVKKTKLPHVWTLRVDHILRLYVRIIHKSKSSHSFGRIGPLKLESPFIYRMLIRLEIFPHPLSIYIYHVEMDISHFSASVKLSLPWGPSVIKRFRTTTSK